VRSYWDIARKPRWLAIGKGMEGRTENGRRVDRRVVRSILEAVDDRRSQILEYWKTEELELRMRAALYIAVNYLR
jgi:hypothetical protein